MPKRCDCVGGGVDGEGGGLRNAWKYHDIGTAPSSGSPPRCHTSSGFLLFCLSSTRAVKGEGAKKKTGTGQRVISSLHLRLLCSSLTFPPSIPISWYLLRAECRPARRTNLFSCTPFGSADRSGFVRNRAAVRGGL